MLRARQNGVRTLLRTVLFFAVAATLPICSSSAVAQEDSFCSPLPAPDSNAPKITVSSNSELSNAVNNAASGTTIFISPGTYNVALNVRTNGLVLRSTTGNRDDVVLDGSYSIGSPISVRGADDVTIAGITVKRAHYHLIHVSGSALRTKIYNVKFLDSRQQFVKINENGGTPHDGEIACSYFELTDAGRNHIHSNPTPGFLCYTGGIDTHKADGWHVRDNRFRNIYCTNGGLSEHCVHFWNDASNTVVERNVMINCARGVGFGLGSKGHSGGQIINNFICADIPGSPGHDVGISLESAANAFVAHNSILASSGGWNVSIDQRFSSTSGTIINNLYTSRLTNRNGANATSQNNISVSADLFIDGASCDLRLKREAADFSNVVDKGINAGVARDIDGELRDSPPDVGADEFSEDQSTLAPAAPENLRLQ